MKHSIVMNHSAVMKQTVVYKESNMDDNKVDVRMDCINGDDDMDMDWMIDMVVAGEYLLFF